MLNLTEVKKLQDEINTRQAITDRNIKALQYVGKLQSKATTDLITCSLWRISKYNKINKTWNFYNKQWKIMYEEIVKFMDETSVLIRKVEAMLKEDKDRKLAEINIFE